MDPIRRRPFQNNFWTIGYKINGGIIATTMVPYFIDSASFIFASIWLDIGKIIGQRLCLDQNTSQHDLKWI